MRSEQSRRCESESGVTIIFIALSITALIALVGLVIDGGRAYSERRQVQNAADAASMAGAAKLGDYHVSILDTNAADLSPTIVYNAVKSALLDNDANVTDGQFECRLVNGDGVDRGACPSPSNPTAIPGDAVRVNVLAQQTQRTSFIRLVGPDSFTAGARSAAQVGKALGISAPFLVCATAPGHVPNLLTLVTADPEVWMVNPSAVGIEYSIYGNDVKLQGRDCGDTSGSFRGLTADADTIYQIPGWWEVNTGNKNGRVIPNVNGGNTCDLDEDIAPKDFPEGCRLVLPLCVQGNGQTGSGFEMRCVDAGLFEITHVDNHDIDAIFLGGADITGGRVGGMFDLNGARAVALAD